MYGKKMLKMSRDNWSTDFSCQSNTTGIRDQRDINSHGHGFRLTAMKIKIWQGI